jgi:hypothetical protein
VGDRLTGQRARQHPNLTGSSRSAEPRTRTVDSVGRAVVLTLLAVDGVVSAVLATMFLQLRIGVVPLPISALISGLVNALLVWVGLQWTSSPRLAAVAVWAWLLTVLLLSFGGPGGDRAFGGPGFGEYGFFVLLVLGAAPPGIVLARRRRLR